MYSEHVSFSDVDTLFGLVWNCAEQLSFVLCDTFFLSHHTTPSRGIDSCGPVHSVFLAGHYRRFYCSTLRRDPSAGGFLLQIYLAIAILATHCLSSHFIKRAYNGVEEMTSVYTKVSGAKAEV